MKNRKIKEAKQILHKLRESIARRQSPFAGMSEEAVIQRLRKTRERLWEEKLAARS